MKYFQMTYFVAVCKHRTISRAAEAMFVSQPAVSVAIKELEEEFGVKLFSRQGNGLVLTEAGEIFLEQCQSILSQTDNLSETMRKLGDSTIPIKIGVPPMIATLVFPKLHRLLSEKYPKISLTIFEQGSLTSRKAVADGTIDLAFCVSDNLNDNTIEKTVVLETELVYCVSKNHRLASNKTLNWEMLDKEKIISLKEDSYQYAQLNEKFLKHDINPEVVLHSAQLATIRQFVKEGYAGTFFFKEVAAQGQDFVGIPMEEPMKLQISLIWKKSSRQLENLKCITNLAKEVM